MTSNNGNVATPVPTSSNDTEDTSHYMLDHNLDCFMNIKRLSAGKIEELTASKNKYDEVENSENSPVGMTLRK